MPSLMYQSVLVNIDSVARSAIVTALPDLLPEIQKNIEAETALSPDDFASLLRFFAGQLENESPEHSWKNTCYAHQLRGGRIPPHLEPVTLGRADECA
jgi:hypothetical protein